LTNCVLTANSANYGGGGASNKLENCRLVFNSASNLGGGAYACALNRCIVHSNSAGFAGGGAEAGSMVNCAITANTAEVGGGVSDASLTNCTLTGNSAVNAGGAVWSTLNNCIAFYNRSAFANPNYDGYTTLNQSCTEPLPARGLRNLTNEPAFVNLAGGDYHLNSNSPCINAGNNAWAKGEADLDGSPRIAGGTVDMGAYEFQGAGLSGFTGWLWQHGLRVDGTADSADSDGDTANNSCEWITDTDPTNTLSVLKMLSPGSIESGVAVTWQSVETRSYFLERASDLGAQPPFQILQSNIVGQAGTTSYTDTNAIGNGPFLYRVGVQE
jgi:hypothetical protein